MKYIELEKVDLRELNKSNAQNFHQWLSREWFKQIL